MRTARLSGDQIEVLAVLRKTGAALSGWQVSQQMLGNRSTGGTTQTLRALHRRGLVTIELDERAVQFLFRAVPEDQLRTAAASRG
jgi:hypothetical protein